MEQENTELSNSCQNGHIYTILGYVNEIDSSKLPSVKRYYRICGLFTGSLKIARMLYSVRIFSE